MRLCVRVCVGERETEKASWANTVQYQGGMWECLSCRKLKYFTKLNSALLLNPVLLLDIGISVWCECACVVFKALNVIVFVQPIFSCNFIFPKVLLTNYIAANNAHLYGFLIYVIAENILYIKYILYFHYFHSFCWMCIVVYSSV